MKVASSYRFYQITGSFCDISRSQKCECDSKRQKGVIF